MAKLNKLGTPPPITDVKNNLEEPEHAPAAPKKSKTKPKTKTNNILFTVRITPEVKARALSEAEKEGMKIGEWVKRAILSYKK